MIAQRELDKAVAQPWTVYEAPADVLADSRLTDSQKRRILESWEHDARELAVAEQENMAGGERSQLNRVLEALARLPGEDERPRGPATAHGSQATPSAAAPAGGQRLTAQDARQGEIILRTPARKVVFIGGIVLAAVVCVLLFYLAAV